MKQPKKEEYAAYYHTYVDKVPEGEIVKILKSQSDRMKRLLKNVSKKKSLYRYAPGKWSVREIIGHLIDSERVMAYRAMRFARNDQTDLPGFDENDYVRHSNYNEIKLKDLVDEFCALRKSTSIMFKNFTDEISLRGGRANGNSFTVRSMAYIMAGHVNHHLGIIKERYLK